MHRPGPVGGPIAKPGPPLAWRAYLKRLLPASLTLLVTSLLPMAAYRRPAWPTTVSAACPSRVEGGWAYG